MTIFGHILLRMKHKQHMGELLQTYYSISMQKKIPRFSWVITQMDDADGERVYGVTATPFVPGPRVPLQRKTMVKNPSLGETNN
jgi:hypothetical protein